MDQEVAKVYGNKVRVRACGICFKDNKLLMVNHKGITPTNFWAPPGGGVDFGHSIEKTLVKEFKEETRLSISPGNFLFGCEYIEHPIHSIELFYEVSIDSGKVKTGSDPELQIIEKVSFLSQDEIKSIPKGELHGIFRLLDSPFEIRTLKGFFRI